MPQAGLSVRRGDLRRDETDYREPPGSAARVSEAPPDPRELRRSGAVRSPAAPGTGVPGRRTVTIQGRGAERYRGVAPYRGVPDRRRPARRPHERSGFKPDRTAMWAVLLCVLMILAAATSSHAAMLTRHTGPALRHAAGPGPRGVAPARLRAEALVSLRRAR